MLRTLGRGAKQLEQLVSQVLKENTQLLTELGVQVERRTFDLWPVVELLMMGLGLAIVKTFVEAHDGTVTVESVEGQGSTFRFTLPRSAATVAAAPETVAA